MCTGAFRFQKWPWRWLPAMSALVLCCLAASSANAEDEIRCPDGTVRRAMNLQEVSIQYQGASFAGTLSALRVLRVRFAIEERTLQQATAATQEWNEYLKGLVDGWNSCVLTAKQYNEGLKRIYPRMQNDIVDLEKIRRAIADGGKVNERRLRLLLDRYFSNLQKLARLAGQDTLIERITEVVDRRADEILRRGEKNTHRIIERLDELDKRTTHALIPTSTEPTATRNGTTLAGMDAGLWQAAIAPSPRTSLEGLAGPSLSNTIDFVRGVISATGPSIISIPPSAPLSATDLVTIGLGTSTSLNGAPGNLGIIGSIQHFGNIQVRVPSESFVVPSLVSLGTSGLSGVGPGSGLEPTLRRFDTIAGQQILDSLWIGDVRTAKDRAPSGTSVPSVLSASAQMAAFSNMAPTALTLSPIAQVFGTTSPSTAPGFPFIATQAFPVENRVPGEILAKNPSTGSFALMTSGASPIGIGAQNALALTVAGPVTYGDPVALTDARNRLAKDNPPVQGALGLRSDMHVPTSSIAGFETTLLGSSVRVGGLVPSYNVRVPWWDTNLLVGQEDLARAPKYTWQSLTIEGPCR